MTEEIKRLLHSSRRIVGLKQTVIAIEDGLVELVVLAADADDQFKQRIIALCKRYGVCFETVPSRLELGRECGIDVSAAVVSIKR